MSLDSSFIPYFDNVEDYGLSKQNVVIRMSDSPTSASRTWYKDIVPRAVFSTSAIPASRLTLSVSEAWLTLAVFDLPSVSDPSLPSPFPFGSVVYLKLVARGVESASSPVVGRINIYGSAGQPSTFFPEASGLDSRPTLRLRAHRASYPAGFEAGTSSPLVAGIEFEIEYPSSLQNPVVYPMTEAAGATAVTGPGSDVNRVRVLLVDGDGFRFSDPGRPDKAGDGPFVDVVFQKNPANGVFPPIGQFVIRKLFVTDVNGNTLIDRRSGSTDSTTFFDLVAVDGDNG